ncbi:MAG: dTMP kinase [Acidobacteriota bacterium]
MSGFFITLEGIDGSGKSTQLCLLKDWLTKQGRQLLVTREPGGTKIGDQIRQILLDGSNSRLTAMAELLLYAADRAQHVSEEIRPALAAGQLVLCDRYTDATLAYQGYGRGLSHTIIKELNSIATGQLSPDLTLLFDLDVEIAQARVAAGRAADRLDREEYEFHERVRHGYLEIAQTEPNRFIIVPAAAPPDIVFDHLLAELSHRQINFVSIPT